VTALYRTNGNWLFEVKPVLKSNCHHE